MQCFLLQQTRMCKTPLGNWTAATYNHINQINKTISQNKDRFSCPWSIQLWKDCKIFTRLPVKRFKIWINFSKSTTYYILFETYFLVLKCLCMSPDTIFMKKFRTKVSDRYSKLSSKVIFNNNLKLHRYTENTTVWETVTWARNKSKFVNFSFRVRNRTKSNRIFLQGFQLL